LLLALNAGLPGLATIHANSAREALVKRCTLPPLAGAKQGRRESARTRLTAGRRAGVAKVRLWSSRGSPEFLLPPCEPRGVRQSVAPLTATPI
jgi:hypothetical protein